MPSVCSSHHSLYMKIDGVSGDVVGPKRVHVIPANAQQVLISVTVSGAFSTATMYVPSSGPGTHLALLELTPK